MAVSHLASDQEFTVLVLRRGHTDGTPWECVKMTFKAPGLQRGGTGDCLPTSGRVVPPTLGLKHYFLFFVLGRCARLSQSRSVRPESQSVSTVMNWKTGAR